MTAVETTPEHDARAYLGRHEGMASELYHALDACSASRLSKMRRSPAHCRASLTNPDTSPTLDFGTAVHAAILEPDSFDYDYAPDPEHPNGGYPKGWRNTNDYKATRAALEQSGRKIISASDREACMRIRNAVWESGGDVGAIMHAKSATEVSYVAEDPDAGVLAKCRPDIEVEAAHTIVDLKTTVDAGEWKFARSIYDYGYHIARAWYLHTLDLAGLHRWDHFLFLVVEKSEPWGVALYDLDPEAADKGRREMDNLLALYAHCEKTGRWPAYPPDIRTVGIPAYAFKESDSDE